MCFNYDSFVSSQWDDCSHWHGLWCQEKKQNETPPTSPLPVCPLVPFTNHSVSNFVTPPADLNSDVAGANGMWVVWGGGGGGQWQWDEASTVPQQTLTQSPRGLPTQYVNVNVLM